MMSNEHENLPAGDPLIDEVRAIRRSVCEQFDNDVDRLCDHLQEVEREYHARTGRFAGVPRKLDHELFPESAAPKPDPLIEEVRSLKEQRTPGQKSG
jgi:hypothetical protein